MNTRQMVTIGAFVVVLGIIVWQAMGLFGGGGESAPQPAATTNAVAAQQAMGIPQPAKVQKAEPMSEREMQLMQLQQQTEAKYIAALNELQMLKIEKEIAETSKAINAARLDSVKSQKGVVELLTAPAMPTPDYTQALAAQQAGTGQQAAPGGQEVETGAKKPAYTVISVSKVRSQWNAVVGYGGTLYSVSVGDVLRDGSKVVSISNSGVVLDKDGQKMKVSLVPII